MKANVFDPEKYCHEGYDDAVLEQILDKQKQAISYQKRKGHEELFGLLCLFDDILDDARVMRNSNHLHILDL